MDSTVKTFRKHSYTLIPVLIIIAGAVIRLFMLGSVPGGMHQDESFVAWNAYAILHEGIDSAGNVFPVYMADWGDGHSALYVWLTIPLLMLNGGHVTPFISRLPQAVIAILTLIAVWDMVRRIFGRNAGIWSALILSLCPWHIMMSRWGLDANLAPGFLVFGLYFFIRALENKKYLILSAIMYGLCLYSYAIVWPIVPIILLLQSIYALSFKKIYIKDKYSIISIIILFLMALPLMLFVLVNSGVLEVIRLPFMTIPRMNGYRGAEVAFSLNEFITNFRKTLSLLWHQNTGSPYDILLPWGLFYDIGRVFIVLGVIWLLWDCIVSLKERRFYYGVFLLVQLIGGGVNCIIVSAVLHQINSLYIPLVMCEVYGIVKLLNLLKKKAKKTVLSSVAGCGIAAVCIVCTILFQVHYYTGYRSLVDAYFAAGLKECVEFAEKMCDEKDITTITVEKGAQWPRLLLYTEELPSQYLKSVEYDVPPAPKAFTTNDGIRMNTRINYDNISEDSIYIIYYTDVEEFSEQFDITGFEDWYVAVPK